GPAGWLPPETAPPPVAAPPPPQPGYGPFGGYTAPPVPVRRPRGPHGEPISGRWECAAWWTRAGAFLLDWAIVLIVPLAAGIPLIAAGAGVAGTALVLAGPPLAWGVYAAALMARSGERNGQTLGKQALRIRVVRDGDEPVGFGYGVLRELAVREVLFAVGSSL